VSTPWLNYVGICTAVASVGLYAFVKPTINNVDEHDDEKRPISVNGNDADYLLDEENGNSKHKSDDSFAWLEKLSPMQKRLLGIVLAILAGLFYGVNFDPPQWLIDHKKGSDQGLDYVWSHFCGIFLASTGYFLIYCALKRNRPSIYPQAVLPGVISGVMWAIAQSCFFIANQDLGMVLAFPIIATGPGAVGCLWGIFVFKEITGLRNFLFFGAAVGLNALGVALITVGKVVTI